MKTFLITMLLCFTLIEITLEKKIKRKHHKKHLIIDNNPQPLSLQGVVRRTPTITYGEASARIASSQAASSNSVSFSNSNSHNGESSSFGKTAAIVSKKISLFYFYSEMKKISLFIILNFFCINFYFYLKLKF